MSPSVPSVVICTSPKAGAGTRGSLVPSLAARLEREGMTVWVSGDIEEVAERAVAEHAAGRLRVVIAAGGDGTLALVAGRLPPTIPLMPLPLGTENLMARYLGQTAEVEAAVATVRGGRQRRIDAGMADERMFLLMCSCGLDAEVVRRMHLARAGHIRHWSYAKPIVDSLRSYRYPPIHTVWDPGPDSPGGEMTVRWAFVFNLPRYARGLPVVPGAVGDDGLLDLCLMRRGSLLDGFRYLGGVLARCHHRWRDVSVGRSPRISLGTDDGYQVPYQLDGDFAGHLPVEIRVLPERVTLLIPARSSPDPAGPPAVDSPAKEDA